jgi:ribosomal protein L37AE/L43A
MKELSFCPYCSANSHKILNHDDGYFFCRDCNVFFKLEQLHFKCPKCDSEKIEDSDFPSPDGQIILQCKSCKKMFTATELFKQNKI